MQGKYPKLLHNLCGGDLGSQFMNHFEELVSLSSNNDG